MTTRKGAPPFVKYLEEWISANDSPWINHSSKSIYTFKNLKHYICTLRASERFLKDPLRRLELKERILGPKREE